MVQLTRNPEHLDTGNPDLHALMLTVAHASALVTTRATTDQWAALTGALVAEHTPQQLANMLTGACALIARTTAPIL